MTRMRPRRIAIFFLLACAAWAQQPATTIRSEAELVLIPTIVSDRSGAHIPNLKKEDFTILENGTEQKVAIFEEVHTTVERVVRLKSPAPRVFTNKLDTKTPYPRITIIVLDWLNTGLQDQQRARTQLLSFIENSAATGEPMMLVVLGRFGVRVVQDFTTDPAQLAESLRKLRTSQEKLTTDASAEAPRSETQSDPMLRALLASGEAADRAVDSQATYYTIQLTLNSMKQIARALAGVPGRKSMLWATAGFPFSITPGFMSLSPSGGGRDVFDALPLYQEAWHMLNAAQISVYPIDLRGLTNPYFYGADVGAISRRGAAPNPQVAENSSRLDTFLSFADATGGRAFYNTNDLSTAFRRAADDSASYYMIGYYRHAKKNQRGWIRLKVKVDRGGADVRARDGFFAEQPGVGEKKDRRELASAMLSPMDATGIAFEVRWLPQTGSGSKLKVPYELNIPYQMLWVDEGDNNHLCFQWEVLARTTDGKMAGSDGQTMDAHLKAASLAQLRDGGLHFENTIELVPGMYNVRFLVRDTLTGREGTVTAPIRVE